MKYSPSERKALILTRLQQAFAPTLLEVIDESAQHVGHQGAAAGGSHFALKIAAPAFHGVSLLKQHQLIYQILQDLIPQEIHALKIRVVAL